MRDDEAALEALFEHVRQERAVPNDERDEARDRIAAWLSAAGADLSK